MSVLWTDIIDPATLTGYARESLAAYEQRKGTLARWLPNREVQDVVARFFVGQTGLVEVAKFRAYDAEPELGRRPQVKRVAIELPALGQNIPVSEYEQIRARGGDVPEEVARAAILGATDLVVRAVADAIERLRGIVIATGKATIDQDNFVSEDDFGRPAEHSYDASPLWDAGSGTDPMGVLEAACDLYRDATGDDPGAIVMSGRAFRVMASDPQFKTVLVGGGERPATEDQVRAIVEAAGLPTIYKYDRRVRVGGSNVRVTPDTHFYVLPAPVDPDDGTGSEFGATFWGRTLTSTDSEWGIEPSEQPGVVAGVYRNPKPPMGIEVISDAIGLPVVANAEMSVAVKVLSSS